MPVTADQPAPYAPAKAIMEIVSRHRNKGLPSPVNADVLARAGISDSLIPRTLQALQVLDLLDEDLKPSEVFETIRKAPEAEYQQQLEIWLRGAYADALAFVDPANDDEVSIRDAFRGYKPVGQQARMVSLFTGLFVAAGARPIERQRPVVVRKTRAAATVAAMRSKSAPKDERNATVHRHEGSVVQAGLPPAISGLLASLPETGNTWTKAERDRFYTTFGAVLDFCYPVSSKVMKSPETEAADDQ